MGRFLIFALFVIGICLVHDCLAKPTDSNQNEKYAEDDSDMMMEPDEFSHISVVRSEGQQIYPSSTEYAADDEQQPNDSDSHSEAAQNFYPPFYREPNSPPLGHSRPYFNPDGSPQQQQQQPLLHHQQQQQLQHPKFNGGNIVNLNIGGGGGGNIGIGGHQRSFDPTILGSGDFGVIRGGTFYPDDETPYQETEENSEFNQFYGDNSNSNNNNNNNGHGRPQADAYVQKFTYPEEQFANFRDFADINTPSDYASSQFVVVYAAKNSTSKHPNPKNIFEQLELLDQEKALEEKKNRFSQSKLKLANTKLEKKYKKKLGPKEIDYEPLLALS